MGGVLPRHEIEEQHLPRSQATTPVLGTAARGPLAPPSSGIFFISAERGAEGPGATTAAPEHCPPRGSGGMMAPVDERRPAPDPG